MWLKLANDKRRLLRLALSVLVVSLSFWYIGVNIREGLTKAQKYPWGENFAVLPLCVAVLLLLLHYFADGAVFTYLVRQTRVQVKPPEALRVFFLANLGKYLPGSVWVVAGKTYWLSRRSVSRSAAVSVVSLELGLNVAACAFASLPLLYWLLPASSRWTHLCLLALAIPLFMPAWQPARRMLARVWPAVEIPVSAAAGSRAFLAYACSSLAFGLGFWFLVRAVYPVRLAQIPFAMGSLGAGWLVGFLVVVAPGGLGVREGMLMALLKCWLPLEVAAAVAIGSRLWMTAGDLLGLAAAYALRPAAERRPGSTG